jgi:REP element-mobilizing transposase RayT
VLALVMRILSRQRERAYADKFKIVHYSIQSNHIHLIVEAADGPTDDPESRHLNGLRSGVSGFMISFAKRLNRMFGRKGAVWSERHFRRELESPSAVKNALQYLFNNFRHHGTPDAKRPFDVYSSAQHFDGFSRALGKHVDEPEPWPDVGPDTWLLRAGWQRQGLIDPSAGAGPPIA